MSIHDITDPEVLLIGIEIGKTGIIDFLWGDRSQAAEVFVDTLALAAGPAVEVLLQKG